MNKRPKNGIAKALRQPMFKMQVVKDQRRKSMLKEINKLLNDYMKECEDGR